MNAKRMRWIIGLMAAALLGSICLQIYWIGWNIRLNEEQFDKNVFETLNRVADKLQYYENEKVLEAVNRSRTASSEANVNLQRAAKYLENGYSARRVARDSMMNVVTPPSTFEDNATMWEFMKVSQMVDSKPLAERISLDLLAQSMQEELASHGIKTQHQYGVFSKDRNDYVIVNDHYVVKTDKRPMYRRAVLRLWTILLIGSCYLRRILSRRVTFPSILPIAHL
jgi:two-component system phosphate regulon sensor histidine kinase PhoR